MAHCRVAEASCAEPITNSRDSLTPHIRLDRVDDQVKHLFLQLDSISLNERQVLASRVCSETPTERRSPHKLFPARHPRATGNKEYGDRNNDAPNLVGVREQARTSRQTRNQAEGPGDIYRYCALPKELSTRRSRLIADIWPSKALQAKECGII